MTLDELEDKLKETGLPVVYRNWKAGTAPPLPWICYLVAYSNNFAADGGVYARVDHIQVELYTALKDQEAEERVETALSYFVWEKTETYLESEKCFQILYEIEV